jgi:hypothetical protein
LCGWIGHCCPGAERLAGCYTNDTVAITTNSGRYVLIIDLFDGCITIRGEQKSENDSSHNSDDIQI